MHKHPHPRIDLHAHSDASDGTEPPAEVVRRAVAAGVDVLALTDHDTTAGHAEAFEATAGRITIVPGMEMSCRRDGLSVHLLAYLFDPADEALTAECALVRGGRDGRATAMVERLAELGVPITMERVAAVAGDGVVGRPHIARVLAELGVVPTPADAFTAEWIGTGGRAHVTRYAPDPVHAIRLVRAAGGAAVLAHPKAARRGYLLPDAWIADMAEAGLNGVETNHPDHDAEARTHLRGLAGELDLIMTGSSDDHGELTGHRLGCETTTPEAYAAIMDACRA
ncbi:PHP domain-containing protein [Nonomuraea sp. NBC_01738]|uniref:PHP domain-containing protein n=1 Tax=Nonomuraea sp. NBC_01738 TaxID=2976003 RepID=UPI002E11285D|nr:PHP domain-containing protein [Nonomuraea sp. NBC_01738]